MLCCSGLHVATSEHAFGYQDSSLLCQNLLLLSLGAALAFMLEMSEFLVVSQASSLTLSVAGIFKVFSDVQNGAKTCRKTTIGVE